MRNHANNRFKIFRTRLLPRGVVCNIPSREHIEMLTTMLILILLDLAKCHHISAT